MKRGDREAQKLVQKAVDEPLTPAEQEQLHRYQETAEGRSYTAVHHILGRDLPDDGMQKRMNRQELKQVVAQIDARVQRQRRTRRALYAAKVFATATAVMLVLFLGANWIVQVTDEVEPGAELETAVTLPTPTPTLALNMRYADLWFMLPQPSEQLPPELYSKTVAEVAAQVDFSLGLPTQLNQTLQFVGADINPENGAVEIAFAGSPRVRDHNPLWVLSQRPLSETAANLPLTTLYLPFQNEAVVHVGPNMQKETTPADAEAVYQANEYYISDQKWTVVNTLAWQADGRQYTLTLIAPVTIHSATMESMAQSFHLAPFAPGSGPK